MLLLGAAFAVGATNKAPLKFGDENVLFKPDDYREWIYIGTALTPNDLNGGKADFPEFHNVYMDQAAATAKPMRSADCAACDQTHAATDLVFHNIIRYCAVQCLGNNSGGLIPLKN